VILPYVYLHKKSTPKSAFDNAVKEY